MNSCEYINVKAKNAGINNEEDKNNSAAHIAKKVFHGDQNPCCCDAGSCLMAFKSW